MVLVLIFSFSACGQGSKMNQTTGNVSTGSTVSESKEEINQDPLGKYDPGIELTTASVGLGAEDKLPQGQTPENNVWTQAYAEKLGINLKYEFTVPLENADQKVDMVIASGDMPDLLAVNLTQFNQLHDGGQIEDISNPLSLYSSPLLTERLNYDQGRALSILTFDNKVYGIPWASDSRTSSSMLWIRTDWLKKLNLPEPQNMQDVLKIAEAFALQDPDGNGKNDTYGLGVQNWLVSDNFGISGMFNAYHACPTISGSFNWLTDSSNNLIPAVTQVELKAPLLVLQDFYKRGIIDKEFAVKDSSKLQEELNSNKFGMEFGGMWDGGMIQALKEKQPELEWKPFPIPSIDSNSAQIPINTVAMNKVYVIKKGYAHPEALIKAANLTVELEYGASADYEKYVLGPNSEQIGRCVIVNPASVSPNYGQYLHIKDALASNDSSKLSSAELKLYNDISAYTKGDMTKWSTAAYFGPNGGIAMNEFYTNNNAFLYNAFYGSPTPTMIEKSENLTAKFVETMTKIIMGADIKELDVFNEYWEKQGGNEITREVNDWYKANQK